MNWLDLFDDDALGQQARFCAEMREERSGLTDGDDSVIAPYIGMCPDESDHEDGSPLNFGRVACSAAEMDRQIQQAFRNG